MNSHAATLAPGAGPREGGYEAETSDLPRVPADDVFDAVPDTGRDLAFRGVARSAVPGGYVSPFLDRSLTTVQSGVKRTRRPSSA
ncbi:hypothetical protein GCM10009602_48150 [Nocardiopsis tropica]